MTKLWLKTILSLVLIVVSLFTVFRDAAGNLFASVGKWAEVLYEKQKNDVHPSELVGKWYYISGKKYLKPEFMELFENGTGWCNDNRDLSWKVENKYLKLYHLIYRYYKLSDSKLIMDSRYELRGSKLIIYYSINNDSNITTYVKEEDYEKAAMENIKNGSFTDVRDDKTYKTVEIGEQVWMAENLNYEAKGSICYENRPYNCDKYGRLYNWSTAKKSCPKGWHLPSNKDWDKLVTYVDDRTDMPSPYDSHTAGQYLKGGRWKGPSVWSSRHNIYGFSGLPGGWGEVKGKFYGIGCNGVWWSSSEDNIYGTYTRDMNCYRSDNITWGNTRKSSFHSVRCVQD